VNAIEWIICGFGAYFILSAIYRWIIERIYAADAAEWAAWRAERDAIARKMVAEYHRRQIEEHNRNRQE
jgi:hypothetical protein